ncbi:MAG: hypothetical protein ABI895_19345 [Deltaproteobacteria bacterium]
MGWLALSMSLVLGGCGAEGEGGAGSLRRAHLAVVPATAQSSFGTSWSTLETTGLPTAREEAAFVALGGKGYLLGGRGNRNTGVLDPSTSSWTEGAAPPLPLHHFQALALGDSIYALGAMTGGYPNEVPVADVYTYTPSQDAWAVVGQIPEGRRRGGAGLVFHAGSFYLVGGIQNGHVGGFVPWLDRHDPATGQWEVLPDAPRPRDHFQAAVVAGRLYAAGGRTTSYATGEVFSRTIAEVDVFDFDTHSWSTLPPEANLPTPRAGSFSIGLGDWLLVVGGESARATAHAEVQGLYVPSGDWLNLPSLQQGRHGSGLIQLGDTLFVTAGSANQGGGPLLTSTESWLVGTGDEPTLTEPAPPEVAPVPPAVPATAAPPSPEPAFTSSNLVGESLRNPTSLQFGPDGRLYVSQQDGLISVYDVERRGPNDYRITATEALTQIRQINNHDDDTGAVNAAVTTREVTGLLVRGPAERPEVLVTSSDSRIGAGGGATDLNLDTNSGILSRLRWTGSGWEHVELVRGLPRSEENHASNGLTYDPAAQVLYLAQGGHTNAGAPSNNFAFTTDYALSGALLRIDLPAIEALPTQRDAAGAAFKYDLETLDDPLRPNRSGIDDPSAPGYDGVDVGDPFGGDDGFNQAKWTRSSLVQVHAGGLRNPYDVVLTENGRLFTVDNGANPGWGGHPAGEAAYPGPLAGRCTNEYVAGEPGSTRPGPNDPAVNNQNGLHWVRPLVPGDVNYPGQSESYYPGHPNPTRGNPLGAGLYRNGVYLAPGDPALPVDWPPVDPLLAHPAECDFRNPGETDNSLTTFGPSTNGITEYTAANFGGALRGNLLLAGYTGNIYRVALTPDGTRTLNCPPNPAACSDSIASGFARQPLDVTALGPSAPFPGTVWIANIGGSSITVLEPVDYDALAPPPAVPCAQRVAGSALGDADGDSYTNQDEAQSGTNPCSAASRPSDADGDASSDRADADDDNDGIADVSDPFPLDADNGLSTRLPLEYEFFSSYPGTGLYGLGFTGLMSNGVADYLDLFDAEEVIAGGTSGLLTIPSVGTGDARGSGNSQRNAFLLGVDPRRADSSGSGTFSVSTKINGPFFNGVRPAPNQSLGLFLGTGSQDDYVKLVLEDERGLTLVTETAGSVDETAYPDAGEGLLDAISITLFLTVDPVLGSLQPAYLVEGGQQSLLGAPILLSGALLEAVRGNGRIGSRPVGLAVGLIATSPGLTRFGATWDYLKVMLGE